MQAAYASCECLAGNSTEAGVRSMDHSIPALRRAAPLPRSPRRRKKRMIARTLEPFRFTHLTERRFTPPQGER